MYTIGVLVLYQWTFDFSDRSFPGLEIYTFYHMFLLKDFAFWLVYFSFPILCVPVFATISFLQAFPMLSFPAATGKRLRVWFQLGVPGNALPAFVTISLDNLSKRWF